MGTKIAAKRVEPETRLGRIAAAAGRGDREAYAQLVAELWPDLVALARSVLGRTVDAEDAVQDALVVAWQQLPSLTETSSVKAWAWKIVYREAILQLRKRAPAVPIEAARHQAIHLVPRDIDIPRMLELLTPPQRAVIYMSIVEGMTSAEIGAAIGASAVTVRIHRRRALARLRRRLGVELS